jgi:hypothetical protein
MAEVEVVLVVVVEESLLADSGAGSMARITP